MPCRLKSEKRAADVLAPIPAEILNQIAPDGPMTPADVDAVMRRFKKVIIERALGAELSHHLGYAPGRPKPDETTNHRNGTSGKRVLTDHGPVAIDVPSVVPARLNRS
jgi:putative transposase